MQFRKHWQISNFYNVHCLMDICSSLVLHNGIKISCSYLLSIVCFIYTTFHKLALVPSLGYWFSLYRQFFFIIICMSWVRLVNWLALNWMSRVWFPVGLGIFFFAVTPIPALGHAHTSITLVLRVSFPEVKWVATHLCLVLKFRRHRALSVCPNTPEWHGV